ncbi:hypothetical protein L0666_09845 [Octadecabacter sp. CECT 8868]|uniref:hypothetical protein n=1 Tax=Octadecabacter algicola TaxID=2909342 RepID=UPI001F290A54|nr:hypothetical protein [Octadecabacter algicola]MCF2905292.1 hypothetical protein [Octadecabacter algicola]
MGFDFASIDTKKSLFVALAILAIIPLHLAAFAIGIPSPFRSLLDASFKVSFSGNFTVVAVLVAFVARYLPQAIFGLAAWWHSMSIEASYFQRGYRRAYVGFTGLGKNGRSFKNDGSVAEHFRKASIFGRNEARLANLKKKLFQARSGVVFYEENRAAFTAFSGIALFSIAYLGVWRGLIVCLATSIFALASINYSNVNTRFRFDLSWGFWRSDSNGSVSKVDLDDVLLLVSSLAIASATSGYLKVGQLKNELVQEVGSVSRDASIIAATSNGIVFYSSETGFFFQSWPLVLNQSE